MEKVRSDGSFPAAPLPSGDGAAKGRRNLVVPIARRHMPFAKGSCITEADAQECSSDQNAALSIMPTSKVGIAPLTYATFRRYEGWVE